MITGFVDTNILIGVYRANKVAQVWFQAQPDLAVSSVVWLEFMQGASGKAGQKRCLEILAPLDLMFLTEDDQRWAMAQVMRHRFSHSVEFKDCLIASVCHRLKIPLYTLNVKDFQFILDPKLIVKPLLKLKIGALRKIALKTGSSQ